MRRFFRTCPPKKLPGANFYPEDMTREEFEAWVKTLAKPEREQAEGFFTVIHRDANRKLHAVPYSQEYRADLEKSAKLLEQAAGLTDNATLKKVLDRSRGRVPLQRLLRERHRMDGSRRPDRHHDWALRNLQRRYLRLQGGVRSLCQFARRRRDSQAEVLRRSYAGSGEQPADRSEVSQSEARRELAHSRGERSLCRRRRSAWRPDRGLQPAERRARSSR